MIDSERQGRAPVCGIVVTYHPDPEVQGNIEAMVRECGLVVVVDNGSDPAEISSIAEMPRVEFMPLHGNEGLAKGLNRGVERARQLGFSWVVTFDQDSRPEIGMVAALWDLHERLPAAAVVGPRIVEPGAEPSSYRWLTHHPRIPFLFRRTRCVGADLPMVTLVVTSGSLIDVAVWEHLGKFGSDLFIDYIDIDYCLRVARAGRSVAVAAGAVLHHRLGARTEQVLLGRDLRPMNHAPFRHFYMARNRVATWRRHALAVPHWAAFDFCFMCYNLGRVLLFEQQRWAKVKAMVRGTWHGLCGRSGPMP